LDSSTSRKHAGVIIALIFGAIYLATPTKNYYWDGIAFAVVIERHQHWYELFSVHHLLYEFVGYGLYHLFGGQIRALYLMQSLNSAAAAAVLYVVFRILRALDVPYPNAIAWTALMGAAATFWKFSTDADSYILANLFLAACFWLLLPGQAPAPVRVGLLHTGALMLHQLSALFYPVVLLCLWKHSRERWLRNAAVYTIFSAGVTLAVYSWAYRSIPNPEAPTFAGWVTHHAKVPFFFNAASNAAWMLTGTLRLFLGGKFGRLEWTPATIVSVALIIASAVAAVLCLRRVRWRFGSVPHAPLWLWLAVYVTFLFFWEPYNTFYRLFYLLPLIALLAVATRDSQNARLVGAVAAVLFFANYAFYIHPNRNVKNNPPLAVAIAQQQVWPPGTGVVFGQFVPDLWTISYFNPQVSWIAMDTPDPARLAGYVEDFGKNGGSVWVDWTYLQHAGEKAEPFTFRKINSGSTQ
jgi:hypothetical protein